MKRKIIIQAIILQLLFAIYLPAVTLVPAQQTIVSLNDDFRAIAKTTGSAVPIKEEMDTLSRTIYNSTLNAGDSILNRTEAHEHFQRAQSLTKSKQFEHAITEYIKAISFDSSNAQYYWELGNAYSSRFNKIRDFDKAINVFKKAIFCDPKEATYYWALGNAYTDYLNKTKNYDDAVKVYKQAISIEPNGEYYHKALAWVYCETNNFEQALIEYKKVIFLKPNDAYVHDLLGDTYQKMHDTLASISEYEKALVLYKQIKNDTTVLIPISFLHTKLGDFYQAAGKIELAISEYEKAILAKAIIGYTQRGIKLGLNYIKINDYVKAASIFKHMVKNGWETYFALVGLGKAYTGQNLYIEAISIYKTAIDSNPKHCDDAYFCMGLAYSKLNQSENAIDAYKKGNYSGG